MKNFVVGILALLVSACSGSRTDQLLLNQIQTLVISARQSDEVLQLSRIDAVKWDALLLIKPYTAHESLDKKFSVNEKLLATKIDQRDDITVLVFTRAGEVVNVVEFPRSDFDFSQVEILRFEPNDSISLVAG